MYQLVTVNGYIGNRALLGRAATAFLPLGIVNAAGNTEAKKYGDKKR